MCVLQMCSHLVTGSANNGGEDSTGSVISGKSSLDQARAVVAHKSGNFLVVAHGWFSGWSVKETSRQGQRRREQEPKALINTLSTLILHQCINHTLSSNWVHKNGLIWSLIIWSHGSCGSVVEHCVSSAKVVGSIPREHMY